MAPINFFEMFNKLINILLIASAAYEATATDLNGDDYEDQTAEEKFNLIKSMLATGDDSVAEI